MSALFSQSLEEGCNSWRGCAATPRQLVPKEVKFECGGDAQAETCVDVVKKCTASADADAQRIPRSAERRGGLGLDRALTQGHCCRQNRAGGRKHGGRCSSAAGILVWQDPCGTGP